MFMYRRDVKQYHPTVGTDIRDAIYECINLCIHEAEPHELVHNDIHIVVFPSSSALDIYMEWNRQQKQIQEHYELGLNSK